MTPINTTATSKEAFTPGPWMAGAERYAGRGQLVLVAESGRGYVCEVQTPIRDGEYAHAEREANARLIAAAPELYAKLEGLLEYVERYCVESSPTDAAIADAFAALAKARGES